MSWWNNRDKLTAPTLEDRNTDDNTPTAGVLNTARKNDGRISKWDENGNLNHEAEYSKGELVQITLKNGKPFDPNQIIDISEDPEMANLLFE